MLKDFDGIFSRSYSVAKYKDGNITLLIKIKEIGRAGRALRSYKIGDTFSIEGVYGKFILRENEHPKVYIATGTGLAPIYHMLESSSYS